ncbi:DUF4038 domain-containing protein [Paenibacillus montanisoli]|uniref:DUF4038 domain-containing protein n=1 Tax=Paenibacillus montanisoli TaxID=2081970 RepID=A0A328U994_9BACL|nr:DUF4038 domain-containing protein [Paenibacillus montanisoli]RAP77911.1 hypothetical protein DL346_05495 [Paenibacillus montanisoli]
MTGTSQNVVTELILQANNEYRDPFNEIQLYAVFMTPDGKERRIPGFWGGGQVWKIRYSSEQIGQHSYTTVCSDPSDSGLHGQTGEFRISPYEGNNPLFRHGSLRSSANKRYLEHNDGTPFFWLADTWWMGLTKRLEWPDDVKLLTQDRVDKGFTVVQLVAGLFPDMDPLDDRGANEAGLAWNDDFTCINPAYFDHADNKIAWLVESGLVPCIVGCWGYYLDYAGKEAITKHWDYLLARYGAYNVVWCVAGEAVMPFYKHEAHYDLEKREKYIKYIRREWTEVTRYIKDNDSFARPVTIHPTNFGHDMIDEAELLDLDMLQTGHWGYHEYDNTVEMIRESVRRQPKLPVINGEVCYEGSGGTNLEDTQRYLFWTCLLNGACGHTYGAMGIWQMNARKQLYGASPHGLTWGNALWEDAYRYKGSFQVGIGKKIVEKFRWWEFEPHPEWINHPGRNNSRPSAAGIPGQTRVVFLPCLGGCVFEGFVILGLEDDVKYRAYHIDPETGEEFDLGEVIPGANKDWKSPAPKTFHDWLLVLQRENMS